MGKKKVVEVAEPLAAEPAAPLKKTGEVHFREADGSLWLAESFVNEDGETSTQSIMLEPAPRG